MTETCIYDKEASPVLKLNLSTKTRGNLYKLDKHRTKYLRKYFTNRIINLWNNLPDTVVMSETVNQFKNRLDKFWSNQDLTYNYNASGTDTAAVYTKSKLRTRRK